MNFEKANNESLNPHLPLITGRMCEHWYPEDRTMPV